MDVDVLATGRERREEPFPNRESRRDSSEEDGRRADRDDGRRADAPKKGRVPSEDGFLEGPNDDPNDEADEGYKDEC